MIEVGPEPLGLDLPNAASRLSSVISEYQRLRASLIALGSQLTALQRAQGFTAGIDPEFPRGAVVTANDDFLARPTAVVPESEASKAPLVKVNLLGPFHVEVGGRTHGPGTPGQVRTVLEFLISQGRRPTPRDALLDLLWPDADPDVACSRLRVVMHTLRKTIPGSSLSFGDIVVTSGNNFLINPDAEVWVDVEEFERHWLAGWRLQRSGKGVEALNEYEQAEALYRGDYLEDEPYADWTLLRREALRDAYASILSMLATMSLHARDYIGCIIWAQKLLAQDNCREDAYRMLMTSHHHLGQSSRAAYWYNLCAWSLQRELGIEPSTETRELFDNMNK